MAEPVVSRCQECDAQVVDGPEGGYCCSRCGFSIDPPAVVSARYAAVRERHRRFREETRAELARTRPRRRTRPSGD